MNKSNWVFDLAMSDAGDVLTPNSVTMETKLLFKHAVSLTAQEVLFGRHFSIFFVDDEYFWNKPLSSVSSEMHWVSTVQ